MHVKHCPFNKEGGKVCTVAQDKRHKNCFPQRELQFGEHADPSAPNDFLQCIRFIKEAIGGKDGECAFKIITRDRYKVCADEDAKEIIGKKVGTVRTALGEVICKFDDKKFLKKDFVTCDVYRKQLKRMLRTPNLHTYVHWNG